MMIYRGTAQLLMESFRLQQAQLMIEKGPCRGLRVIQMWHSHCRSDERRRIATAQKAARLWQHL